jgi:predicted CopG family antitoxin
MVTTIEIEDDQKERLDSLKRHDREAYKTVVERLLQTAESDDGATAATPADSEDVALILDRIDQLPDQVADELEGRLR